MEIDLLHLADMRNRTLLLLPAVLSLVACSSNPQPASSTVAPPTAPPAAAIKVRSNPTKAMIAMSDPAVNDYIVKDVSDTLEGSTWRWTYERPELRFQLGDAKSQKVEVHFSVADATFKTTGPVTAKFFVNNQLIGTMKLTKAGDYVFSKPVPAGLLKTDDLTTLAVEARPYWTSQNDGRHLTLILTQAGFLPETHS
jgi:hypothetical protein